MSDGRVIPRWRISLQVALVVLSFPIAIAVGALASPFILTYCLVLRLAVEIGWGARGRRVLLVYSRSPVWQEYIETSWLPRIREQAVILNWSDRSQWLKSYSLAALAFRCFAPRENFNPMAILFGFPLGVRRIGFYYAFRDWKHGNALALQAAEAKLFAFADRHRSLSA